MTHKLNTSYSIIITLNISLYVWLQNALKLSPLILRDDLLHPGGSRLVGRSNDDVVVPGFDDIPSSGVEVVGIVGLGLGPAGHVERGTVTRLVGSRRSRYAFRDLLLSDRNLIWDESKKFGKMAVSFHRAETLDPGKSLNSTSRTLLPRALPSNVP